MPFQSLLSFDSPRNILTVEITLKNAVLIHFSPNHDVTERSLNQELEYSEYIFPVTRFMTLG